MIIQICDICNKKVLNLHTLILYKQPIEYCDKCEKKVEELRKNFERELALENTMLDNTLKRKEKKYINNLKKNTKSS